MRFDKRIVVALVFFVVPAIIYVGFVTRFSFNLFDKSYGWHAYNHYAMALSRFSHSVPAEAISGEGQYFKGRVYMYYGMLPALLRLPLVPFIDLHRVPLSNLYIWGMLVVGQFALQHAALLVFEAKGPAHPPIDVLMLALVSYAIWFSSGSFLLAHGNIFYYEPYSAAIMLTSIYVAMLVRDLLIEQRHLGIGRLLAYSALASLCLFARQTFAIGLYLATVFLLLPDWRALRADPLPTVVAAIRRAALPLLVLFAAGIAYLALAYARTGHVGSGWEVDHYGYYLIGKTRERLEVMVHERFNPVRIVPNLIYVLVGGTAMREHLIAAFGGGTSATFGAPARHLLFTPFALLMAVGGVISLYRRTHAKTAGALLLLLVTVALAATAALQLSYPTMQYRYTTELWPLIVWLMLIAMRDISPISEFGRWSAPVAAGLVAVTLVSLTWSVRAHISLTVHGPLGKGSLHEPLPPELAALATSPDSRDPSIEPFNDREAATSTAD